MAVTAVNLFSTSQESDKGQRTGEKVYLVQCNSATDDAGTARVASSGGVTIPVRGEAWSATDAPLRCLRVRADLDAPPDPQLYRVNVSYTTGDVGDENENPLDEPPEIEWTSTSTNEQVYEDKDQKPITNSAGVTFDPPIEDDVYDLQCTITRNVATSDLEVAEDWVGAINTNNFNLDGRVILAKRARFVGFSIRNAVTNGIAYKVENIVIAMRRDGWSRRLLDHGYTELTAEGEQSLIRDVGGDALNQPVNLDGNGKKLPEGGTPVFLIVNRAKERNFASLNLPA